MAAPPGCPAEPFQTWVQIPVLLLTDQEGLGPWCDPHAHGSEAASGRP